MDDIIDRVAWAIISKRMSQTVPPAPEAVVRNAFENARDEWREVALAAMEVAAEVGGAKTYGPLQAGDFWMLRLAAMDGGLSVEPGADRMLAFVGRMENAGLMKAVAYDSDGLVSWKVTSRGYDTVGVVRAAW